MDLWRLFANKRRAAKPADDDFDPAALLEQAQREMMEMHRRNRERAVQAISAKNNLQQSVDDVERKVLSLQARVEAADERGDTRLVERLRHEAASYQAVLIATRESLAQAIVAAELVKTAIKYEENRIRAKTAEAMLLKSQWSTIQVQRSLSASSPRIGTGGIALEERAVRHAMNRRFVRRAAHERDFLQKMLGTTEERVTMLREAVRSARTAGDGKRENQLLREMEQAEALFVRSREAVSSADDTTARAEAMLAREERDLRSAGLDPETVTDAQIADYEARLAAVRERPRTEARERKERERIAVAVVIAVLIVLLILLA